MNKHALIVVDMVYDFIDPNGKVYYESSGELLPKVCDLIKLCREKEILIIFIQHYHRKYVFDKELTSGRRENCLEGTGGEALIPSLGYDEKTDYLVKKRRYNSFCGTDLDLILRENEIDNLIICGIKTNNCIRATVEGAYHLDYLPIVVSDCVSTNDPVVNKVHLEDIEKYLGKVVTTTELKKYLEGGTFNG